MTSLAHYDRFPRPRHNWPFDPFDRLFDDALAPFSSTSASFKMNVEDTGDAYVVAAELPGVKREEIDVELNEGRLSISVDKKETEEEKGKNYLYKETSDWTATRGIYLKDAATTGLSAKLDGGILTVNVPKIQEKANATKITIE